MPANGKRDVARLRATASKTAGERIRTVNIQLGRLMLYQLSYARAFAAYCSSALRKLATSRM